MIASNQIGRYEVLETLDGGGQGTVYLGREEGSEEVVTIKVMHLASLHRQQFRFGYSGYLVEPSAD